MLYFGVQDKNKKGHYLFDKRLFLSLRLEDAPNNIDGGFCPETREQGKALLTHSDGKTILAFWDYSGDSRPGSNSNFIENGTLSFAEMLALAKAEFPSIFHRFDFDVTQV